MNKPIALSLAALLCLAVAGPAHAITPKPAACAHDTLFLINVAPSFLLMADTPPAPGSPGWMIDTAPLRRAGANPWALVGTWDGLSPLVVDCTLADLGEVSVWLGLRNSDDQGARFDLKVELLDDGEVIATGTARCIAGVTRNPQKALAVKVAFDPIEPLPLGPVPHVLSLRIAARMGTLPDRTCPGHSTASGLRFYFGGSARAAGVDVTFEDPSALP